MFEDSIGDPVDSPGDGSVPAPMLSFWTGVYLSLYLIYLATRKEFRR